MSRFLRGDLKRLCGPLSPITYMRTADYVEPYTDYGQTGRVLMLAPETIIPWHSGVETVYIGPREIRVDYETMIFIPAEIPLKDAAERLSGTRTFSEAVEVLGAHYFQEARIETLVRLDHLQQTHNETERLAAPLRQRYQSLNSDEREAARDWMMRMGLTESDLSTAWHHLPDERREFVIQAVQEITEVNPC
ncbi:MAG: hypothetical protein KDA78_16195 [Planctomycetaceae bacterium]|nr:hypothetical protein [Planctomycetaceae bacterium]